jgi:hypothetical protein
VGLRRRTSPLFRDRESDGSSASHFEARTVVTAQLRNAARALRTGRSPAARPTKLPRSTDAYITCRHARRLEKAEALAIPTELTMQPRDVDLLAMADQSATTIPEPLWQFLDKYPSPPSCAPVMRSMKKCCPGCTFYLILVHVIPMTGDETLRSATIWGCTRAGGMLQFCARRGAV